MSDPLQRARLGFDAVETDPVLAQALLNGVLSDRMAEALARSIAYRGLGRLLTLSGEMDAANRVFSLGVETATQAGLVTQAALIRVSWASARQAAGDNDAALALLEQAEAVLGDADLGVLISQRAYLHWTQGRAQLALEEYDVAIPILREAGDSQALVRVLGNRGVVQMFLGRAEAARADLHEQLALARSHPKPQLAAAVALHSLGCLEGRLGNLPAALRLLEEARDAYSEVGAYGRSLTALDTDHCEVLLQAMLAPEADEIAARVVNEARSTGHAVQVAEALLMRARSLLIMRRFEQCVDLATDAHDMFLSSDRMAWAALASYIIEQARVSMPAPRDGTAVERLAEIADALDSFGWIVEAAEVRVHAGRTALEAGLPDVARQHLTLAAEARYRGIAAVRAEAWHAAAMLRLADGDTTGARRAITAGLRALHRHRATLGAMELRAHASAHGVELGKLGLRLALRDGSAANVLVWSERWRAGSFALAPAPDAAGVDTATSAALAQLRELHARAREVPAEGTADAALANQVQAAERTVTRAARLLAGQAAGAVKGIDVSALRAALTGRSLIELVELDGRLHAVVVTVRRTRLVDLGETAAVTEAHDHLLFALRRVSMLPAGHPSVGNAERALDAASAEVDHLLIAPLQLDPDPVVIVPTGDLHRVAWSTLPSLAGRAVTVAPSATWWLAGRRRRRPRAGARSTMLLIEGPDLDGTSAELAAIAEMAPGATALLGRDATVARCLARLPDVEIAHVAAHGTFRSDNPMFSSLRVADGEIWVHDLARLSGTPDLVILTACDAGRSGVMAGDELLGTATALLSIGVQTVIAPLLPVPDDATARFGVRLHQHLVTGASPEQARANAAAEERATGEPAAIAVAAAFHCIGTRHASVPIRPKNP